MSGKGLVIGVLAVDDEWGIGKGGTLPWYNKDDLRWFKAITEGHSIIMGGNTWDSLPVKPLPNRDNYVLTSREGSCEGFIKMDGSVHSIEGVKAVVGGVQAFNHYHKDIDAYIITRVQGTHGCDVFFDSTLIDSYYDFSPMPVTDSLFVYVFLNQNSLDRYTEVIKLVRGAIAKMKHKE